MTAIPVVFMLGLVAGAIAVPMDQLLQSEMRNDLMEQKEGLPSEDSVCFKPEFMLDLTKRLAELERLSGSQAQRQAELERLAERQAELERRLDQESSRVDDLEQWDRSMTQTALAHDAQLRETVHVYVNASLKSFGVNANNVTWDDTDLCQVGTIGHEKPQSSTIPWPKSYYIYFDPPFKNEPKMMYGLMHIDVNRYLRVNVKLVSFSKRHANFEIESWKYPQYLYGCKVRWMACP